MIIKRRMRRSPSHILHRIITLNQQTLLGALVGQVPPLVLLAMSNIIRRSNEIGVDPLGSQEVLSGVDGPPVGYSEWVVGDRVRNGSPDVDNLHSSLEETVGLVWEVDAQTGRAGIIRLVCVNAEL